MDKGLSPSKLKGDDAYSVNLEGGQLTTDVSTKGSEASARQVLERMDLLKELEVIEPIEGGLKLVWSAGSTNKAQELAPQIHQAAKRISELKM